ncbi:hypothetical protein Mal4_42520 [Maioricimonas rarisocia]|uniref:Uncharacterized protein n=1 Tax=Maioricimonas rarisocia TaxID=2528026 RepID=A0A517ZBT5_9PLAN|nr:hypothetical protein Mal4_42520 [Maioricimonas rarisocia]
MRKREPPSAYQHEASPRAHSPWEARYVTSRDREGAGTTSAETRLTSRVGCLPASNLATIRKGRCSLCGNGPRRTIHMSHAPIVRMVRRLRRPPPTAPSTGETGLQRVLRLLANRGRAATGGTGKTDLEYQRMPIPHVKRDTLRAATVREREPPSAYQHEQQASEHTAHRAVAPCKGPPFRVPRAACPANANVVHSTGSPVARQPTRGTGKTPPGIPARSAAQ